MDRNRRRALRPASPDGRESSVARCGCPVIRLMMGGRAPIREHPSWSCERTPRHHPTREPWLSGMRGHLRRSGRPAGRPAAAAPFSSAPALQPRPRAGRPRHSRRCDFRAGATWPNLVRGWFGTPPPKPPRRYCPGRRRRRPRWSGRRRDQSLLRTGAWPVGPGLGLGPRAGPRALSESAPVRASWQGRPSWFDHGLTITV